LKKTENPLKRGGKHEMPKERTPEICNKLEDSRRTEYPIRKKKITERIWVQRKTSRSAKDNFYLSWKSSKKHRTHKLVLGGKRGI